MVAPSDKTSMADAILKLIGDNGLRATLGKAAKAEAQARWSWSLYATELEQVCREALGPDATEVGLALGVDV